MKVQMGMVAVISIILFVLFPATTSSYSGQGEGMPINDLDKPSKNVWLWNLSNCDWQKEVSIKNI